MHPSVVCVAGRVLASNLICSNIQPFILRAF